METEECKQVVVAESAIMFTSGFRFCNKVLEVRASEDVRRSPGECTRYWKREGYFERIEVLQRVEAIRQRDNSDYFVDNNGAESLVLQLEQVISALLVEREKSMSEPMKLIEVITISGKPGLYRLLNSTRMPFTVQELSTGKKSPVFARDRVSALSDISIYTEEVICHWVKCLEAIQTKYGDELPNETDTTKNSESLHAFMAEVLPIYDKEVRDGDIKKLVKWYNILRKVGFTSFVESENELENEDENQE